VCVCVCGWYVWRYEAAYVACRGQCDARVRLGAPQREVIDREGHQRDEQRRTHAHQNDDEHLGGAGQCSGIEREQA